MIPAQSHVADVELETQLDPDLPHGVGVLQQEVVGHEHPGVGEEGRRLVVAEPEGEELLVGSEVPPRQFEGC